MNSETGRENVYDVKIGVRQKSTPPLPWTIETFRLIARSVESARVNAMLKAMGPFSLAKGWEYDVENIEVTEVPMEEIERVLEERTKQVQEEVERESAAMLQQLKDRGYFK